MNQEETENRMIWLAGRRSAETDNLISYLEASGFDVSSLQSGKEVFRRMENMRPDMILLDAIMPDMDGFEVCRRLKANNETKDIPVIFMTAFSDTVDKRKGFEVGAADYIMKPYLHEAVLARVSAHLTIRKLRNQIEEADKTFKQQLSERTSELVRTNEELRSEIDAQRRAEESLRESEERFRSTFEQAAVGIAHLTPDGRYIRINQRFCEIIGYTREEAVTHTFQEITHPDDLEPSLACFQKVLTNTLRTYVIEKRYIHKDGSVVWGNLTVSMASPHIGPSYLIAVIEDITQKKLAQKALRKNEEHFRAIADYTYDWEEWIGPDGKLIWTNPAVERITGYSREEYMNLSNPLRQVVCEQDMDRVILHFEKGVSHKLHANDIPFRIRRKDGSVRWVSLSYQPIYEDSGNYMGLRSSIRDITMRKKAETELRKREDQYKRLVEAMPGILYLFSPERGGIYYSSCAESILGYPLSHLYENPFLWHDSIHPDDLDKVDDGIRRFIEGEYFDLEYRVMDASGNWHRFRDRSIGRCAEADEIIIEGFAIDVTDRKLAEEELKRTKNYLDNIIHSSPSVIAGINSEGKITAFNAAAEKLSGIRIRQAMGKNFAEVLPAYAECLKDIKQAIQKKKSLKKENVRKLYDGHIRYYDFSIYPLAASDLEDAVLRIDDVTDRARLEKMIIQSEKMMSVGGLAAGMAHEINNPLSSILSGVQNTLRRLSPNLTANTEIALSYGTDLSTIRNYLEKRKIFRYLDGILTEGKRCAKIVSDMLSFSRYSDPECKVTTNMNQLLDDTLALAANDYDLKKKYDFRHITIRRRYDATLPQVPCVVTEIQQVILNLLKNAAYAMDEIKAPDYQPVIDLRTSESESNAVIEVADNGPGMDEKTCKRIFEPFFTTKEVGVGTGLGLSVSYFIIADIHKGSISAESEPGKGARFIIHLPLE